MATKIKLYILSLAGTAACCFAHAAFAQDKWVASATTGAGFDGNPQLEPDGGSAAFYDLDVLAGIATERGGWRLAAAGQAKRRDYVDSGLDADETYKLAVVAANAAGADIAFSTSTKAEYTSDADFRAFDVFERISLKWEKGVFRPFLGAELRYATLNEQTNITSGGFLEESLKSTGISATPGFAINREIPERKGALQVGVAATLSATRYEEPGPFGIERDNDRIRPTLFATYAEEGLTLYTGVSQLYGAWSDSFFRDVDRTLFEFTGSFKRGPATVELSALQAPQETTFVLSPLIIVTLFEASLNVSLDERRSVRFFARDLSAAYLGTGFETQAQSFGAAVSQTLDTATSLTLEGTQSYAKTIAGDHSDGARVLLSLTRKIESGGDAASVLPSESKISANELRRRSGS